MTIARMKRVVVAGVLGEKENILSRLQDKGCLHLVPLRSAPPLAPPDAAGRRRAYAVLKHLDGAPRRLRPWPGRKTFDLEAAVTAVLANKERLRKARDRRDFLQERIEGLEPFGEFDLPPLDALRGRRLWFYVVPVRDRRVLDTLELPWAVVGRDNTRLFIAVISEDEPSSTLLPVPRTHTGTRQLSKLRDDLIEIEIEIETAEAEWAALTRHRLPLALHIARDEDADDLRTATLMTRDEDAVFALAGWVPADDADAVYGLAGEMGFAVLLEDPGPDEAPPTLLDNPGRFEGASALTTFYMTPAYNSWDPSLIVFFSFAIFFAMILADAGYAALLGLGLAFGWKRLGGSDGGIKLRNLLAVIIGISLIYGIAAGSYFSISLPPDSLLGRIAFIDVADTSTMMTVSIVIGILHISLANGEIAWRNWGTSLATVKLGWIAATFGGLLVWLTPAPYGYILLAAGLATVFGASALGRPVNGPMDWLMRIVDGAMSLTGVTRMFGDVLSYMRLFALGLSSASLGGTFNALADQIAGSVPGLGMLLAILVLILGHGVNLALGILSGTVHGLRLNVIEFFGWSLTEEGYPFKAFARREANS